MDKETQRYYDARFSMTGSEGWQDLLQDVEKMITTSNNLLGVKNEQEMNFRKGQLDILVWLVRLRDIATEAYDTLKEDK